MKIKLLILVMFWQVGCSANSSPRDLHLRLVVKGHIVDQAGRPVSAAKVQARLGLDLDGAIVKTDLDGSFVAEATSGFWFKGCPSVNASAEGYSEEWLYFECWDKGERKFERTIVLKPQPVRSER